MRWESLQLYADQADDAEAGTAAAAAGTGAAGAGGRALPLFERGAVTRTFDTPGFQGITFYEIQARSVITYLR